MSNPSSPSIMSLSEYFWGSLCEKIPSLVLVIKSSIFSLTRDMFVRTSPVFKFHVIRIVETMKIGRIEHHWSLVPGPTILARSTESSERNPLGITVSCVGRLIQY